MTCNTSCVQIAFKRRRPIQSTQFYISMIDGAYLGKAELLVTLEMLFGTCCFCLIPQFFSWWNQSQLATLRCSRLLYIHYVYNMTYTASINWWRLSVKKSVTRKINSTQNRLLQTSSALHTYWLQQHALVGSKTFFQIGSCIQLYV